MNMLERLIGAINNSPMPLPQRIAPTVAGAGLLPGEQPMLHSERGFRTTPQEQLEILYLRMEPSFQLRQTIMDIRDMDYRDPRVKKIHERTARSACKGGLKLTISPGDKVIRKLWSDFVRRTELDNPQKMESDLRGLMMEGNLPMQWVLDLERMQVVKGLRMPTETIKPVVSPAGTFLQADAAYEQWDWLGGQMITRFPLWQLNMARLRPDNFDNWGSMGRPYLDATRTVWRQLTLIEKDLVVRRHTRAPLRLAHVLEGATDTDLQTYEARNINKQGQVTTDFYLNRKGAVTALQGDAHLDQIADVGHLLDTFFAGAPAPKGLFGYVGDLSRDILEDIKRDYYEELDALQDTNAFLYTLGFRLELLLRGINPDADEFEVGFAERRTETRNQCADLALKYQAIGVPATIAWREAGLDPHEVQRHAEEAARNSDAYPNPNQITPGEKANVPRVTVTPGNARKGESATSISNA